jgi:predicted AlkP superfamily pyrophosphatase or phosphodiesterase
MKRHIGWKLLNVFAVLLICAGCAHSKPAPSAARSKTSRAQHVFIVSFDGGKPAVMRESEMPTLFDMVQNGAVTWTAQTVRPSITLVSHTSMLTGVQPAKHKITWNDWQPKRGLVTVPTVFSLAHRAGFKTALFAGKEKFRHLDLPGSLDKFAVPGYYAKDVAAAAAPYIIAEKPNLTFIHFADSDGAGHEFGWGSAEQKKAFADADAALKVVRDAVKKAGIENTSTFILSADHGGHDKTHGTDSPEDMCIPWIAWGANVKPHFWIQDDVSTCDTAATALWLLGVPVPDDFDGKPVTSAFK